MRKINLLLTAVMLFFVATANAQFVNNSSSSKSDDGAWDGIRVSYSFYKIDEKGVDYDAASQITFGYVKSFSLSKDYPLFIETGANVSYAFGDIYENTFSDGYYIYKGKMTISLLSASIPVNLGCNFKINDEISIFPYVGANVKFHSFGEIEYKTNVPNVGDITFDIFDDDEGDGTRLQGGVQLGATLNFYDFNIGACYSKDLNEIADGTDTSAFTISFGYNF